VRAGDMSAVKLCLERDEEIGDAEAVDDCDP
jgi:hypothetical protein